MSGVISAQVSDELLERIDAIREGNPPDYDESRSATVRRLVRRGLDTTEADGGDGTDTATPRLLRTALIAFLMGYPTTAAVLGYHELAVSFVVITTLAFAAEPQLRTAWQALKSTLKT